MNNQEILDFIVKKENLQIAMEISTHIEDLKRQTHNDFWLGMNQELVRLFEEQRLDKWTFGKFNMKRLRTGWQTAYYSFKAPKRENPVSLLGFGIGQTGTENNYRLYCGVTCHNISHADFVILRGLLASEELNNSSEWWVGWGYLPIFPFTVDFIFEMHNNRKEFITNSAQSFWQKFLILRPEVEKINHQLLETNEVIEN